MIYFTYLTFNITFYFLLHCPLRCRPLAPNRMLAAVHFVCPILSSFIIVSLLGNDFQYQGG